MSVPMTIVTVLQLICCVALIFVVMVQSGKSEGLSAAFGGSGESFLAKNKAKTMDAVLAKATKWIAFVFMILTLSMSFL